MGKRFVRTHDADARAIALHLKLLELEKMDLIDVEYSKDNKKIIIGEKGTRRNVEANVDTVLLLDVAEAKRNGGTYSALWATCKPAKPRVPQAVIEEQVHEFLAGDD